MSLTTPATADSLNKAYSAPIRSVVIIDADPMLRDWLAAAVTPAYRSQDFSDATAAIARVQARPAAILIGPSVIDVTTLRQHTLFAGVPVVHCISKPVPKPVGPAPEASITLPALPRQIVDVVTRLGNKAVEESWKDLPAAPREALKRTLTVFNGIPKLIGTGSAMDFKDIANACQPVIDAVKQSGQSYVFAGLSNHNDHSYVHSLRMSTILALFGHTIGLEETLLMTLASAGLVHDIGKTVMPIEVLEKTAPLSAAEMAVAKNHVNVTIDYLSKHSDVPKAVLSVAAQHHERIDGSGYPRGLKGEEIDDLSRMAAIVDVFCALTERRPHRAAMDPFQALEVMQENIREKLDQKLVRLFSGMLVKAAASA